MAPALRYFGWKTPMTRPRRRDRTFHSKVLLILGTRGQD